LAFRLSRLISGFRIIRVSQKKAICINISVYDDILSLIQPPDKKGPLGIAVEE
jgi:hypothetical protein